jgi:predicted alpha/beta-hydrolase family hydrolase
MTGKAAQGTRAHGVLSVGERRTRWRRHGPLDGRPLVLLSHGAGASMTSPFMLATRDGLVARGCTVVSLNFAYMQRAQDEQRRRPPDPMPVLIATLSAALSRLDAWCRPLHPRPGIVLVGKSMGGRVGSMLLAAGDAPGVRGAVYLGYPLHPAGKPERLRRDHLSDVAVPQLFLSGSKDALATRALLQETVAGLGPDATLHWIEGGDHSLAIRRSAPLEGAQAWLDRVAAFVTQVAER